MIVIHKEIFWGQINISAISLTHSFICFDIEGFFFFLIIKFIHVQIFLVGLILMILPLGFIVDEVAKEFENVIFIVWSFSSY